MDWIQITVAVLLGFALGYLTSKSMVSDHFVGMGEIFIRRLLSSLKNNEATSININISRYDINDDDEDGDVLLDDDPADMVSMPWERN